MRSTPKNTSFETIACDFDGVIAEYRKGWFAEHKYGVPMDGAKEGIARLQKKYNVVIFTCRPPEEVKDWLERWGFPPLEVTNTKPGAIAYLDDRAVRFTSWEELWLSHDHL